MIGDSCFCNECGCPLSPYDGVCDNCDNEFIDIGCGNLTPPEEDDDEESCDS